MKTRFVVIGVVVALWLTPALALAQEPAVTLSVEAGLDGYYRVGRWLPLRVELENTEAAIDGRVEVVLPGSGGGEVTYRYPVHLPTQSRKQITLYLSPQEYTNRVQVKLLDQSNLLIEQQHLLKVADPDDRLYGVVADQPSAFNALQEIDPPGGAAIIARLTARSLPD